MPIGVFIVIVIPLMIVAGFVSAQRRRKAMERDLMSEWGSPTSRCSMDQDELMNVARYWRETRVLTTSSAPVDDITWNDLDMDAVFRYLNRAQSIVGEEALYAMLREINVSDETLSRRNRWIQAIDKDEVTRLALQNACASLARIGVMAFIHSYPPRRIKRPHMPGFIICLL